ncbi:MAG: hypothetical protein ABIS12_13005 [Bacteroidia bacterium]
MKLRFKYSICTVFLLLNLVKLPGQIFDIDSSLIKEKKVKSYSVFKDNKLQSEFKFYSNGKLSDQKYISEGDRYTEGNYNTIHVDQNGNITSLVVSFSGDTSYFQSTYYNKEKKRVQEIFFQPGYYSLLYFRVGEYKKIDSVFYDKSGNLLVTKTYWGDTLHILTLHSYDTAGNRTDSTIYVVPYYGISTTEPFVYKIEKYTKSNLLILKKEKVIESYYNKELFLIDSLFYKNDLLISRSTYRQDFYHTTLEFKCDLTYDSLGNKIRMESVKGRTYTTTFKYDLRGNLIEKKVFENSKNTEIELWKYDKNGHNTSYSFHAGYDIRDKMRYNCAGRLVKYSRHYGDSHTVTKIIYNQKGLPSKEKVQAGRRGYHLIYKYEYYP